MKRFALFLSVTALLLASFGSARAARLVRRDGRARVSKPNAAQRAFVKRSFQTLNKGLNRLRSQRSTEANQLRSSIEMMKVSLRRAYVGALREQSFSLAGNAATLAEGLKVENKASMMSGKRSVKLSQGGIDQTLTMSSAMSRTRAVRFEDTVGGTTEVVIGQR